MMRTRHIVAVASLLVSSISVPTFAAGPQDLQRAQSNLRALAPSCQPGIDSIAYRNPEYLQLYSVLAFNQRSLTSLLSAVVDVPTYSALLTRAEAVAATVTGGRVVITLPDGTVVVDTAAEDDPGNTLAQGNSYEHFAAKTVNENHNSRIAILAAQQYPCGLGLERKLSTSTGVTETYFAIRLGDYLDSAGTARLSAAQ